jgi:type II secretory pathway pseudopilin PulG
MRRQACIPGARRCRPRRTTSCGAFLIETLVAVLVFSVAAAGVFSLLANGLRASDNARSRTEANDVAAATLARMSTEDIVTLADRYDALAGGSGFRTLLASARRLPGVTDTANVPVVTFAPGPSARSQRASVTLYWQLPGESARHQASMTSVVAPR